MTTSATEQTRDELAPLRRNRDFNLLWLGQTVSEVGSDVSALAIPLAVLAFTGSAAAAGLIGSVAAVGRLVAFLPGGLLADMLNRKSILVVTSILAAIITSVLPICITVRSVPLAVFYLVAVAVAILMAARGPAESAAIGLAVPRAQLGDAMGRNQARTQLAAVVGGPLGGFLYSIGLIVPFVVDSASYLVAAVTSLGLRGSYAGKLSRSGRPKVLPELRQGLRLIFRDRFMRVFLPCVAVRNVTTSGLMVAIIVVLRRNGQDAFSIGLVSSGAALGGVLGAFCASRLRRRFRTGSLIVAAGWLISVALLALTFTTSPIVIAICIAAPAFVTPITNAAVGTYRMLTVPDSIRGRSSAATAFASGSLAPFGPAMAGLALSSMPRTEALLVLITPALLVSVIFSTSSVVRHLDGRIE